MPADQTEEMVEFVIEGEEEKKSTTQTSDEDLDHSEDHDPGVGEHTGDGESPDGSDDDEGEGEGESEGEDDDREAIRERRRQERQDRKQRAREREERLRQELSIRDSQLAEMRQRLDLIERRNTGGDIARLQEAKVKLNQAYNYYKDQIRTGTEAQNGAAVAEATEKLSQVREKLVQVEQYERAIKSQSQAPQPMDPQVQNNARKWTQEHPWYDPTGTDSDSRIVLTIDQTLAEEGFDPRSQDYWNELSKRVKKYLPHRASRDNITRKPRSVVTGSGRDSPPGKKVFRLSSERVKAIKDMGIWDDPVARNKMIKQYQEYDRTHGDEGA